MRKMLRIVLIVAVSLVLAVCTVYGTARGNVQDPETMMNKLAALDGVVKVEQVQVSDGYKASDTASSRYVITFRQPIDWNNPRLGTFPQRVFLGYKGDENVNSYRCGGYLLYDQLYQDYFQGSNGQELEQHYDANFIELEYRFFGKSKPSGLSLDSAKYWRYMTSANASRDFHHIITELGKVLPGSTIFNGGSKGGYTTENMAYYFPNDIDAYVSYVAPLVKGTSSKNFYKFVYKSIGNQTYGKTKAARYRKYILKFQKLLLSKRYRGKLQKVYLAEFKRQGLKRSKLASKTESFEASVLETAPGFWQYEQNFSPVKRVVSMPDKTKKQRKAKYKALKKLYLSTDPVGTIAYNPSIAAYYVQSYLEMGNYRLDLSYLRKAGANVKTPKSHDATLAKRIWAPIAVKSKLSFDGSHREKLMDFFRTTDKDIIKIEGMSDPWYSVRMPEVKNPHIHVYKVKNSHVSSIEMLPAAQKADCWARIDRMLQ